MLKIIYKDDGIAYSDFTVLEQAKNIIKHYKESSVEICNISTENMLDALRLCVLQGDIANDDICFEIAGKIISLDDKGNYTELPDDFIDITSYLLREMRHIRMSK